MKMMFNTSDTLLHFRKDLPLSLPLPALIMQWVKKKIINIDGNWMLWTSFHFLMDIGIETQKLNKDFFLYFPTIFPVFGYI